MMVKNVCNRRQIPFVGTHVLIILLYYTFHILNISTYIIFSQDL